MACSDGHFYEQMKSIPGSQWLEGDTLVFSLKVTNTDTTYDIGAVVRHDLNYPFQNLYVSLSIQDSLGLRLDSGLYNINLSSPATGKPFGKKNLGAGGPNLYTHEVILVPGIKFPSPNRYTFQIVQYMRKPSLEGIHNFGLYLTPHGVTQEEIDRRTKETERTTW